MQKLKVKAIIIGVAFALVVAAGCAWRGAQIEQEKARQAAQAEQSEVSRNAASEAPSAELTAEQQAEVDGYSAAEAELAEMLGANLWVDSGSRAQARFGKGCVSESKPDSDAVTKTFIIKALETSEDVDAQGGRTQAYAGCAEIGGDSVMFSVARYYPASGAEQPWRIECKAFSYSKSYVLTEAATSFSIVDFNEDVKGMFGSEESLERFTEALRQYCAENFPTASLATWDKKGDFDYANGTMKLTFTLNDSQNSKVKATVNTNDGTFEMGK